MNEKKNNNSSNLNYNKQYNSNDSKTESTLNLSQIDLKKITTKKLNKIYKNRIRTPCRKYFFKNKSEQNLILFDRSKSSLKSNLKKIKTKFSLIKLIKCHRPKSCSKGSKINFNIREKKEKPNNELKKIRSKSLLVRFSGLYSSFNNIILEYLPVTAKVLNIPKNQKIDKIIEKMDAHIDNRTFIRFKYNKKNGNLFIKFRNIFYFKFYCYYFKGKHYFKASPIIKMIKFEEENGMWDINPKNEEAKKMTNFAGHQNHFFYDLYKHKILRKINS